MGVEELANEEFSPRKYVLAEAVSKIDELFFLPIGPYREFENNLKAYLQTAMQSYKKIRCASSPQKISFDSIDREDGLQLLVKSNKQPYVASVRICQSTHSLKDLLSCVTGDILCYYDGKKMTGFPPQNQQMYYLIQGDLLYVLGYAVPRFSSIAADLQGYWAVQDHQALNQYLQDNRLLNQYLQDNQLLNQYLQCHQLPSQYLQSHQALNQAVKGLGPGQYKTHRSRNSTQTDISLILSSLRLADLYYSNRSVLQRIDLLSDSEKELIMSAEMMEVSNDFRSDAFSSPLIHLRCIVRNRNGISHFDYHISTANFDPLPDQLYPDVQAVFGMVADKFNQFPTAKIRDLK